MEYVDIRVTAARNPQPADDEESAVLPKLKTPAWTPKAEEVGGMFARQKPMTYAPKFRM